MSELLQIILPVTVVLLIWALIYQLNILQAHLYNNHRSVWEEVTFKKLFFVKRESYQLLPFNHKILKILFTGYDLNDKKISSLKLRIKILLLICIAFACILIWFIKST